VWLSGGLIASTPALPKRYSNEDGVIGITFSPFAILAGLKIERLETVVGPSIESSCMRFFETELG
jgi:hypothetical protein